jgi:hypothetical protein
MINSKTYFSAKHEKGVMFEIYWVKDKYTTKAYEELTVRFNGNYHSHDMDDLKRYTVSSVANSYIRNTTIGVKWINDATFMNDFIKTLGPIIDEFQKDVEYRYSLDGWIGRIFIEPFEDFVDWLKK